MEADTAPVLRIALHHYQSIEVFEEFFGCELLTPVCFENLAAPGIENFNFATPRIFEQPYLLD